MKAQTMGLCLGLAVGPLAAAGELKGRLLLDGKPAEGVAVSAVPFEAPLEQARREARFQESPKELASAVTRADGAFTLALTGPALSAGTSVRLTLSGGGIAPLRMGVYDAGDSEDLGDVSVLAGGALAGKVLDARGKPVVGATVTLWPGLSGEVEALPVAATSGTDGTFRFEQATERGNRLRVEAPGQAPVELRDVRAGALRQPVQVVPGRVAEGIVQRADKRTPAAGAVVRFEGKATSRWVEAGPNGAFRLTGLPAGAGTLSAEAGELGQARAPLPEAPGKTTLVLAPTASIAGRVVDAGTGQPLARIRVLARGTGTLFMARSGADGRYALRGLPGGSHRLTADDARYVPWSSEPFAVASGASVERDVPLKPGATLQGRVLDEDGAPIEGARIVVMGAAESGFRGMMRWAWLDLAGAARSGPDGGFSARRVAAGGGQTVNVTHADYEARTLGGLTLEPGSNNPKVTVVLRRGLSVRGVVKDALGQPVAAAEVELMRSFSFRGGRGGRNLQMDFMQGPEGRPKQTTGADGRFAVEGLAEGNYTLAVRKPGYGRARVDPVKVVRGGAAEPLEVTLLPGATISGFVRDKTGKGLEGLHVVARPAGAGRGPGASLYPDEGTGPDGSFVIDGLTAGASYDLQLMSPAGPGARKTGVVAPADEVELLAAGSGGISGRVTDADGVKPVTDFEVSYVPGEGGPGVVRMFFRGGSSAGGPGEAQSVHADDGQFTLVDVPAGKWDVLVKAAGYQPGRIASVSVEAGDTTAGVELRLARGASVAGRVLEASSGKPIVDATVQARAQSGERFRRPDDEDERAAHSGADGRFELKGLAPGTYVLSARHSDWSEASQSVTLTELPLSVDLRLGKGNSLAGLVVSGGRPVAGANVALTVSGGDFSFGADGSQVSDEAGRFRFEHLLPGRYSLSAALRGESGAPQEVVLQQGQSREDVLLQIDGGAAVHGRVLGLPEGQLAGVSVTASGPEAYFASTRSAADGSFELSGAPVGALSLRATAGDWSSGTRSASAQLVIAENQAEASVELRFESGLRVEGRVTRGGQGLGEVWVRAYPDGGGGRSGTTRTDESGFYALEGLDLGDYLVSASGGGAGTAEVHVQKRVKLAGDTTLDLEAPAARLAGVVVEAETRRPLAEADVRVELGERGGWGLVRTDSNGRFAFESLEPRAYSVAVQKPAYQTETRQLTASEDSDALIELRRGEGIGILAHDGIYGTPLRSLMVRALDPQGAAVFSGGVTLDGEGRGEIPSLQPGSYELRAAAQGYAPVALRGVAVPAPQLALTLTPGGTLEIRSGPETQGRPGAIARLVSPGGLVYSPWIFSNDGRIVLNLPVRRVENVAAGRYTLAVEGGPSPSVEVREGETTVVNLP